MKRVLIITYYWPPNGGAGVQRWLRISKYLPQYGWQPVIYTPENPELVQHDPDLQKHVCEEAEIIKRKIVEPYSLYKRFTGRSEDDRIHTGFLTEENKSGWKENVALYIRSNFFIPDARVWWVKPSIRYLKNYLRDNPVDAIVSTGPPHSMHLIALGLKKALGLRWIADMRDPWTEIDFYHQLNLTNRSDAKHQRLEKEVLSNADEVVAVGWQLADRLRHLGAERVHVITNGYDHDDLGVHGLSVDKDFSLVHVGSASPTRNAPELWKALGVLCAEDPDFKEKFVLRFVGPVDHEIQRSIRKNGLLENVQFHGQVPHAKALEEMGRAKVLLLLLNDTANAKGILTSKLFEYLAAKRPILCIGDKEGDVSKVLGKPHLTIDRHPVSDHDRFAIKRLFVEDCSQLRLPEQYSRKAAAEAFSELLA